ncbi:hypothetical protein GCM10025880_46830 [Methylorubrum aminovorans]|nr:hypothetical protein GCM10025880_46830 [Methylorubrum aminovorans]
MMPSASNRSTWAGRGEEGELRCEMEGFRQARIRCEADRLDGHGHPEPRAHCQRRRDQRGEEVGAPQRGDRLALGSGIGIREQGDPVGDRFARELRQRAGLRIGVAAKPA